MIQRTDSFRFPLEVFTELRGGNFDRDNTIKARVAGLVHFAHTAFSDGREDFVRAEFAADRQRHMTDLA